MNDHDARAPATSPSEHLEAKVWDTKTQQPHGGQDWKFLDNFVSDFSVTTNALGAPESAVAAARDAMQHIHHYPAANFEPAKTDLANLLCETGAATFQDLHTRMLLGNGASELIDLVERHAIDGPFQPGCPINQYKEYERAAVSYGRDVIPFDDMQTKNAILAIINPNNPTGMWRELDELKEFIENRASVGCTVLVDESMQPWVGEGWQSRSLISESQWIKDILARRQVRVFIMHSWTKIWACPGIRLGSVICPNVEICDTLKKRQVPWSVNCAALAFLSAACKDEAYFQETIRTNREWRKMEVDFVTENFPEWVIFGENWCSWLWIDVKDEELADRVVARCKEHGVPIRSGRPGYNNPTFIRLGVRPPADQAVLFKALETLA